MLPCQRTPVKIHGHWRMLPGRGIRAAVLMDDHRFHRLSCIWQPAGKLCVLKAISCGRRDNDIQQLAVISTQPALNDDAPARSVLRRVRRWRGRSGADK